MIYNKVFQRRARICATTGVASFFRADSIDLSTLRSTEVSLWSTRRYWLASEYAWSNTYLLKFRDSLLRLTSIRSISRNQTLDAFIGTWRWLPFWIQFLYAADCLPRLGLDDSQPCLLRR